MSDRAGAGALAGAGPERPGVEPPGEPRTPPRRIGRRRTAAVLVAGIGVALLVYGLLPSIAGVEESWRRARDGDLGWLALALTFEVLSFAGYVVLVRALLGGARLGWRVSLLATLAASAATRVLPTGGAGGFVLLGWVVRRSGRSTQEAATALTAFLVVLDAGFLAGLLLCGAGLAAGVLAGPAPAALTGVPAALAAGVILAALALALVRPPAPVGAGPGGPGRRALGKLRVAAAALGAGVRRALASARRGDVRLAGGLAWWALDIATLWACLHAFGEPPAVAQLVMAYFVGMLGNLLPVPGGVGGVDGALIGALIAFGVASGLAVVAVLAYRLFAFWLPTLMGIPAYAWLVRTVDQWPRLAADTDP